MDDRSCRVAKLKCKEVINITDGCRLGFVTDVEIDVKDGTVLAIIVPGPAKFCGMFGRDADFVIPWTCIKRIGEDTILVDILLDKMKMPRPKKTPW